MRKDAVKGRPTKAANAAAALPYLQPAAGALGAVRQFHEEDAYIEAIEVLGKMAEAGVTLQVGSFISK